MPSRFLVYGLVDPRTGELRYVGLTEQQQRQAVERYEAGETTRSLAKECDMAASSIWYMLKRRGARIRSKSEAHVAHFPKTGRTNFQKVA